MDDDFNTADGIAAIFDLVKWINSNTDEASSSEFLNASKALLAELCDVMGLITERKSEIEDDEASYIEAKIAERQAARKAKDFAKADELRDKIAALGYAVKETRQGTEITKL
jgi:cysteinyl-tRNA synthetase